MLQRSEYGFDLHNYWDKIEQTHPMGKRLVSSEYRSAVDQLMFSLSLPVDTLPFLFVFWLVTKLIKRE